MIKKSYNMFDKSTGAEIFSVQLQTNSKDFSYSKEQVWDIFTKHPAYNRIVSTLAHPSVDEVLIQENVSNGLDTPNYGPKSFKLTDSKMKFCETLQRREDGNL